MTAQLQSTGSKPKYVNKQRILTLMSRGSTFQAKKLLEDLQQMMAHSKHERNVDHKATTADVTELCADHNCNSVLFLESKKNQQDFLWLGDTRKGPGAKFIIDSYYSKDSFKFQGNCLKFSRPLLTFGSRFDENENTKLLKSIIHTTFNVPRRHPKSQPFVDKIMAFELDPEMRVYIRMYQILKSGNDCTEIGPQIEMQLVKITEGPLRGETLFENKFYRTKRDEKDIAKSIIVKSKLAQQALGENSKPKKSGASLAYKKDELDDIVFKLTEKEENDGRVF